MGFGRYAIELALSSVIQVGVRNFAYHLVLVVLEALIWSLSIWSSGLLCFDCLIRVDLEAHLSTDGGLVVRSACGRTGGIRIRATVPMTDGVATDLNTDEKPLRTVG